MRLFLRACALTLALLASACQPLPHPLAESRPTPLEPSLALKDSYGITVAPVADAPANASAALAEAMASALRDAEIPASTQGHNRASYVLTGTAREEPLATGRSAIVVDWVLKDPRGAILGQGGSRGDATPATWRSADPTLMKILAQSGAPAIAKLVQEEAPVAAPEAPRHTILVREVQNAPGDGRRSLTRALIEALRRLDLTATAASNAPPPKDALIVAGTVTLDPSVAGKQKVTVTWQVTKADGSDLGKVGQENSIPAGLLDGTWGEVALAVAEGATDGIQAIIERIDQQTGS